MLSERTTPEFVYLQTKWPSLFSYGATARLFAEVFPLDKPVSTAVLAGQVRRIAERLDGELGDERPMFIEGCPREWAALPDPPPPLTVGLDGGYVHGREGTNRKAGSFEAIVGKSLAANGAAKRIGLVNGHDAKPKRRLFEMLRKQGMAANQQVTFLSDGGETVRDLPLYLNPQSEHVLDWFHIAMRLTVLGQLAKGVPPPPAKSSRRPRAEDEEELEDSTLTAEQIAKQLERVKWFLWHGNRFSALGELDDLEWDLEAASDRGEILQKLTKGVQEFHGYIAANQGFLVNYGDRYRNGEPISTGFVESTVNEVISKRMVKKQQMRWTKAGAHRLLQIRVQVLDGELRQTFARWYPGLGASEPASDALQAA